MNKTKSNFHWLTAYTILVVSGIWHVNTQAQIVPYYPIEVFFAPVGYANALIGEDPGRYSSFSHVKIVLTKDLPSMEKLSNTIDLVSNIGFYHNNTLSRNYQPLSVSLGVNSLYFLNDIISAGTEINTNIENLPCIDASNYQITNYFNYRLRIRPYMYIINTQNLILQQLFSLGWSRNPGYSVITKQTSRDYMIGKIEITGIYFTPYNFRLFVAPYFFFNTYQNLPAPDAGGKKNPNNPPLAEQGNGLALGARYSSFRWGYAEAVVEIEKNIDMVFGGNSYLKIKTNSKWENQYFTPKFGYMIQLDYIRHIFSSSPPFDFKTTKEENSIVNQLGQHEVRTDLMLIFNINRNVSIRPEFDSMYMTQIGSKPFNKLRYWLHFHVLL